MKQIRTLTTTAKIRELRNLAILKAFKEHYVLGNQITPLIEDIAIDQGIKYSTAYKVIKEYRDTLLLNILANEI